jgi:hypothetical protein
VGVRPVVLVLLEEIGVGHGRQDSGLVHNGRVVDLFVDRRGVVHRRRLDSLALDDGLDWGSSACSS